MKIALLASIFDVFNLIDGSENPKSTIQLHIYFSCELL